MRLLFEGGYYLGCGFYSNKYNICISHVHVAVLHCVNYNPSLQVWAALLENMPMTAMIRNLGKMSAISLLKPLSSHAALVCKRLKDEALLKKARIHPFNVLLALKTYESGSGDKGKLKWEVNQTIVQALDDAFYASFKVRPLP